MEDGEKKKKRNMSAVMEKIAQHSIASWIMSCFAYVTYGPLGLLLLIISAPLMIIELMICLAIYMIAKIFEKKSSDVASNTSPNASPKEEELFPVTPNMPPVSPNMLPKREDSFSVAPNMSSSASSKREEMKKYTEFKKHWKTLATMFGVMMILTIIEIYKENGGRTIVDGMDFSWFFNATGPMPALLIFGAGFFVTLGAGLIGFLVHKKHGRDLEKTREQRKEGWND